jgi:glutamyl endopeptidase
MQPSGAEAAARTAEADEAALNERVSNTEALPTPAPTSGRGGGETSFTGEAEVGKADAALAEFQGAEETAQEVWSLLSLTPLAEGIETIIGPDNRTRVTATTAFPWRAIVLVTFSAGRCSGALYGRDIVVTAGHCVHSGGSGGSWQTNVRVFPGRNGPSAPYGSCTAKSLHSVLGWTRDKDERFDYGAIKLNCSIGNTTGWLGLWWQGASLNGSGSQISGYPGDKPLEQWQSIDQIRVSESDQVFYFNDTVGGVSGSAVFANRPAGSPWCVGYCIMAIHAYGLHGSPPHSNHNHATRLTQGKVDNLLHWRNLP